MHSRDKIDQLIKDKTAAMKKIEGLPEKTTSIDEQEQVQEESQLDSECIESENENNDDNANEALSKSIKGCKSL